jgi:transglutaminase-like putative cysteine protease
MKASTAVALGHGWCAPKAVARAAGIPARLGFADVRNPLSPEGMHQTMQTHVFVWHGCTERWLDGAWRKATPTFNLSLHDKFGAVVAEVCPGLIDPAATTGDFAKAATQALGGWGATGAGPG